MDDQKDDLSDNINIHFYSDKFPFCSDSDEIDVRTNFSFNDASSNYQKTPRIFDLFYNSSSSDDEGDVSSSSSYQRRLDYMIQFLDRKLSTSSSSDQPLPEFVGAGDGDIWSGSEGGAIKIWPWEAVEKSLSLTIGERNIAALLIERSYIDLRSQFAMNGAYSNIFTSDVKYMLSDHSGAKVWSAGFQSFELWDACTRELLKVFNIDGQIENTSLDPLLEDEMRMKFLSGSKEKAQNSFNFFQRSRNAILGAADAVRRAAVKGSFREDNRRTEALISTVDGMIWTGCANGLLVQWDGDGNRLHDFQHHSFEVQCFCTIGERIWVGYDCGTVQVSDLNGDLLGEWVAHSSPVIDLAVGGGYVFTLANHGGIRGWNIASRGPLDNIFRTEFAGKEFLYTKLENLKILSGTWNVAQGRVSRELLG